MNLKKTYNKPSAALLYLLTASSGAMLALSSLFPAFFVLAWVAFVPLLIALRQAQSLFHAYRLGLCAGLVLYAMSTYWMVDFIQLLDDYSLPISVGFASLYWFYCAQMLGLIATLNYYCRKNNSELWAFAVIVCAVFAFFPTLFSVQVGETQSQFLLALQAIELTGVHGLDFIIALTNGLIAKALLGQAYFSKRSTGLAYAFVFTWFAYGAWSLQHWDKQLSTASTFKLGLIQANEKPSTEPATPQPGYSRTYPLEMEMAEHLVKQQVDLLVWPEMRTRKFYEKAYVQAAYQRRVSTWKTPVVFQDREVQSENEKRSLFNTATLLDEQGNIANQYRKMKLIPVAEYLPWLQNSQKIKNWLRQEFGSFFSDFTPGAKHEYFLTQISRAQSSNASSEPLLLIPLICYEVMFPRFVAHSVDGAATAPPHNNRLLLAQSNNGWFGDTRQPYQHLGASVLRSVENRLPLVHAVNNGPGAVVLPNGETLFQTAYRQTKAYAIDVPMLKETGGNTFYSRHAFIISILIAMLGLWIIVRSRVKSR